MTGNVVYMVYVKETAILQSKKGTVSISRLWAERDTSNEDVVGLRK